MERDQVRVAQRFMEDLRRLRLLAGQPSYSVLERLSGHRLKRATMSDVLNGNRVNLPDWRFVHEFVAACQASATENRLDASELGTVADWKRHWDGATGGVIGSSFPGHSGQSFHRQELAVVVPPPALVQVANAVQPALGQDGSASRPSVWGPVPSRLPDFVGREAWLAMLRQALTRDGRVGVVAVQGLFGVGKTQLAIEYANRHAGDYDLVWWIPSHSTESARDAMNDLAARVGASGDAQRPDDGHFTELFDLLRRRQRYERWLLVFDNANEPEDIRSLIPPLPGDVIVTTRSSHWEASGELLELDVFERAESAEFLRRRMRKFGAVAAHRLAEEVGDLPLLLEHAVESRVEINAYLARLDSEPLRLLNDQPADYYAPIASVWQAAVDQLRADAPDAFDLLCRLAFFGTDPVPREALERGGHREGVSIHDMLREPIRLARAIGKLRRAGLLRMRPGTSNLALHRVTRCLVRDLVVNSGEAEAERVRHDVHLLLAAADPLTPDDPATWRSYEELRQHVTESAAVGCQQELVRKFAVNVVSYLNAAASPAAAVSMADSALAHWDTDGTDDRTGRVDCRAAMLTAKADALFAQGRWEQAFQLREAALAAMRADPDRWTAEIMQLEGKAGVRYRIAGNFKEALTADQASVRAHVAMFGADDPRSFSAVDSLIADLALSGAAAEATAAAHGVYRNCLAYYGDVGHPAVLAARDVFGRCQWLSGEYGEAVSTLAEVRGGYAQIPDSLMLDEDHPWRLAIEIDYAIARRDKGLMLGDVEVLAADMAEVRRRCWRARGANHPQTLAATVVLASILRRVDGRAGEAANQLEEAERGYQSALPGHPYGHACSAFLAAVRAQAGVGDPQREAARAVPVIQEMIGRLSDSVGDAHPLSLTALSALASALARAGELDAALKYGQRALDGYRDRLGPGHPYALAVEASTQVVQSQLEARGPAPFPQASLVQIDFTPLPL